MPLHFVMFIHLLISLYVTRLPFSVLPITKSQQEQISMLSYNKKVKLKPFESIQMADFEIRPNIPAVKRGKIIRRKGDNLDNKLNKLETVAQTRNNTGSNDLRNTRSSLSIDLDFDKDGSISESTLDLVEELPRMKAVKDTQVFLVYANF